MKTVASVVVGAVMLLWPQIMQAKQKENKAAALPAKVLAARKIYVDNRTNDAEIQNDAYLELAKWGRFQIVDSPKKAEIVLRLYGSNTVTFVPAGEKTYVYNSSAGGKWQETQEQVPAGFTRLTLIDPKTDSPLWSDDRKTNGSEAKRRIVDGLRDAIEQGEKARWK